MSSQADNVAASLAQGESMAYHDGVIEGYHDFARHIKMPVGVAKREELEAFNFRQWAAILHPRYNELQVADWARGYKDGYNFRRSI